MKGPTSKCRVDHPFEAWRMHMYVHMYMHAAGVHAESQAWEEEGWWSWHLHPRPIPPRPSCSILFQEEPPRPNRRSQ